MATYFVRMSGSDSNAGTSPSAAWRTLGKALGAAGMASGDTLYIGAGTYRELVTVNMTSATAETKIIGDVDGAQTGDAGEVVLSGYTNGDWNLSPFNPVLNLNGRDFLTFEKLMFIAPNSDPSCIDARTLTSTNITVRDCAFYGVRGSSGANVISLVVGFGVNAAWVIERCRIFAWGASPISVTLTTGTGADYDANVQVRDCLFMGAFNGSSAAVIATHSGALANEGGGVDVTNCTMIGTGGMTTSGTQVSINIPCTIQNCLIICAGIASGIGTFEVGSVIDGGWNRILATTGYTNVTQAATSRADTMPAVLLSFGQEQFIGSSLRPFGEPLPGSPALGYGPSSRTTDLLNRARPAGHTQLGESGTATAGTSTTLSDSSKTWGVDEWKSWLCKIISGTGANQIKPIIGNSATQLTISGVAGSGGGGSWATNPSTDSVYQIFKGPKVETGKATAGAASSLTDGNATWTAGQWNGYQLAITGGLGSGQTATITSNTGTVLNISGTWTTNPDATSTYSIYPSTSVDTPIAAVGALERQDSAAKEETVTDAGGVGIVIHGPGSHDFLVPVDATSTTISIKAQYDSNHGTTNKPQMILLANGEAGVSSQTATMTAAVDTWETLSLTFTPTARGYVTVRVVSRSSTTLGKAYFDTASVS